jgi:DUF4097 and DUF4098 domain-containing protein YvlB
MVPRSKCYAILAVVVLVGSAWAANEIQRDYRYKVHHRASISIFNQYGPISVKPSSGHQVLVHAILASDKVEIDPDQRGDRISFTSHLLSGADAESGKVEYQIMVPADANVTLNSASGPIRAEGLHGDLILEGNTAYVDLHDLSSGHVHIKTLDGPVNLANVNDGHVEITSVSGQVVLKSVWGPLVHVNSNTGKIAYDGDFGGSGEYLLTTYSGDIEAIAPSYASIDVIATSRQGKVENDFNLAPAHNSIGYIGSSFVGTMGKAASSVKLLSFSGRIHLKKR